MSRSPGALRRVGQDDDAEDDISSHGSMPSLEPLMTAAGTSSRTAGSPSSPSTSTAEVRKKNDNDDDDSDDLSMPSLEEIRPDRSSQHGRTETIRPRGRRDEHADDLIGMIARTIADDLLKKNDTDDSDDDGDNDDDEDDDDSSSMPPLEDIATNDKSQGNKRERDGTDIKSKTDKSPASLPPFSAASSGQKISSPVTTGAASFQFNLGANNAANQANSNPSPFTFATGPLASSAPSTKNNDDDAPVPFTFSTKPPSNSKTAGGKNTTGKKKHDTTKRSTFVFSPTSVATPSSAASSPPSTGKSLAFQFNTSSGSNGSAGAPSPKPFFSTMSKDPSLQAAVKVAASSAGKALSTPVVTAPSNGVASSIFGPAPSSGVGGASDRRRRKKRDAAGNKARNPPLSPQLGPMSSPPPFQFGSPSPFAQASSARASAEAVVRKVARDAMEEAEAEAAIKRAAGRAANDVSSNDIPTSKAVESTMATDGLARAADDKSKKPKLPPAPKRNTTAFFIYSFEKKAEVRAQNPEASAGDIAKILSAQFKSLSAEERAKYDQLAEQDKERYQREMATWEMTRRSIKSTPSTTLFVANFSPRHTSDDDLKELIQRHGNICHMVVKKNIAFVTFTSIAEAENVRGTLDGTALDGHCISLSFAVGQRPAESKYPIQFYKEEHREAMKTQNPGWSALQIDGSLQGQYFCRLTDEERARYDKLSDEDEGRFDREMDSWESENRKYTTVNYVEPPTGSCNCEDCERTVSNTFRTVGVPKGDAFTFVNGSSSSMFQNNGGPRKIVRGRRPPNASSASPSTSTNAPSAGPLASTNATSVTAGTAAMPSNTTPTSSNNSVTSGNAPTATTTTTATDTAASASATSTTTATDTATSAPATSTITAASASAASSFAVATPPEMGDENSEIPPRAVIPADESNENVSASNREVSMDANSESEEEANIDPNINAFGALAEDSEENDDDDDDYDDDYDDSDEITVDDDNDDDSEDFPLRLLEDLLPPGVGSRVAARLANGSGPGNRQQLSTNIKPDDDNSVGSSDDEHGVEAAKCCACYRSGDQNHKWKRLVTLPCCGLDGKEKSSSTRFCASCVLKLAVTRPASASSLGEYHFFEDERNEAPVSRFYRENRQSETKRFIECPRCRDILIVKLKNLKTSYSIGDEDDDSDSDECDCSECRAERRANRKPTETKTVSSISVHRATFKAKAWYVGRKRDNAMILWKAAHLHHKLLPLTALGGDKYRANVMKLVGWGILHKVPWKRNVDIYEMDRRDQIELVKLVSPNPTTETDEEVNKEFDLFLELTHDMGYAGWDAIKKFRIDRAIRLFNRFLYLVMYFRRHLPSPPLSLWQEWSVTALNAFNLALVSQFLLITAVYGGLFFGVSILVCRALRNPEKFRSSSRWMYLSAFLGAYLAYRFGKLVYFSPYITFLGFLSPKAIIPLKMFLWG